LDAKYDVLMNGKIVGWATVRKEGLYVQITCECRLDHDGFYRIFANCVDASNDLGICIPQNGRFVLKKKMPIKRFGSGIPSFRIEGEKQYTEAQFVPLEQGRPFAYIQELDRGYFTISSDRPGIQISFCGSIN